MDKVVFVGYNVVWWVPALLVLIGVFDYQTGFYTFLLITVIRAALNFYRVNVLPLERAVGFPFRQP